MVALIVFIRTGDKLLLCLSVTHAHTHTHTHTHTQQVRPPLPTFPGGISCGFVPDFTTLTLATTSLITAHAEEVRVGGSVRVTVVGGMNPEGMFWVRLLPGELRIEDVILQNISNTLQ